MNIGSTVLVGAIAGFTIFLGLPIARLKSPSRSWQAFLSSLATGILFFLLWDVITEAAEPIETALKSAQQGEAGPFALLMALFVGGFGFGFLGLVYFERTFIKKTAGAVNSSIAAPFQLSLMIALGIGLHNFSEGLAIGQAAAMNAISLAAVLVIGFGAHNATEGFGIVGPLAGLETRPSWKFIGLVGLIGGGPTLLGTILGASFQSEPLFVLFLALAAGSILYVISELLHVGRGFGIREVAMWGIFAGFFLGFGTDMILAWAGV